MKKLIEMRPEEFRDFLQHLSRPDRVALFADLTPEQKETVFALINPQLVVGGEVLVTRLLRDIYSERQLEAVMTDFWLNHFNVYLKKGEFAPWYLADYQNKVIRPHAMGKFEDLLVATAQSPAMLFYLDQTESVGPHSLAAWRSMMGLNGPAAERAAGGAERELRARADGAAHAGRGWRIHAARCDGGCEDLYRVGDRSRRIRAGNLCSIRGGMSRDRRLRWDTSSRIAASRKVCRFCICWR